MINIQEYLLSKAKPSHLSEDYLDDVNQIMKDFGCKFITAITGETNAEEWCWDILQYEFSDKLFNKMKQMYKDDKFAHMMKTLSDRLETTVEMLYNGLSYDQNYLIYVYKGDGTKELCIEFLKTHKKDQRTISITYRYHKSDKKTGLKSLRLVPDIFYALFNEK